jgi:O-antigen ligase
MTRRLFEIITDNICYLSILSFIVGVADYLIRYNPANPEHRTASTFFNANYYAFIIEFVILICLYKLTKYPYKWRSYLFIAFLNFAGILFCKTRSAIVAIFIGALFFFIFTKQYKPVAACLGLVLIIGAGIIVSPEVFIPRFDSLIFSFTTRFEIWATAFRGLSYRPIFGQGLWAYIKIVEIKGGAAAMHAHSLWFDIFLSFGFVGTSFVCYYFANTLMSLKKQVHVNAFYHEYSLIIALFVCGLAHCTTDLAIVGVETSIMAMLLFGIVGNGKKFLFN